MVFLSCLRRHPCHKKDQETEEQLRSHCFNVGGLNYSLLLPVSSYDNLMKSIQKKRRYENDDAWCASLLLSSSCYLHETMMSFGFRHAQPLCSFCLGELCRDSVCPSLTTMTSHCMNAGAAFAGSH